MNRSKHFKEHITKIPRWVVGLAVLIGLCFIISRPHQIASSNFMEGAAQTNAHYGSTFK